MILEDFDEAINSTFDPYDVENVIEGFPKIGLLAIKLAVNMK